MDGRGLPALALALLLLADGAPAADAACPMNAMESAPAGARLVGDVLLAGQPERSYRPGEYQRVPGGFALCTCAPPVRCVRKCCKQNKAYVKRTNGTNMCTPTDGLPAPIPGFAVSGRQWRRRDFTPGRVNLRRGILLKGHDTQ